MNINASGISTEAKLDRRHLLKENLKCMGFVKP
jgi:hypothetical protein